MPVSTVPDLCVADLIAGDPDFVWISRWVPLSIAETIVGYTGVSQRPAEMPLALFGWGEAARFVARGPNRLTDLQRQWDAWLSTVEQPSNWHAFVAATFSPDSGRDSVLVVPRVLALHFGRRTEFVTGDNEMLSRLLPRLDAFGPEDAFDLEDTADLEDTDPPESAAVPGALTPAGYADAVRAALGLISQGRCEKIVIARDVVVDSPEASTTDLLMNLRRQSPDTWVFSIDGLIGATPELLGGAHDRRFYARVLAGSAPPEEATSLWSSHKNQSEHAFAVASVTETIGHLLDLHSHPTVVLKLPNIVHLSTELTADLHSGVRLAEVIEAMHPTAAICGTPTSTAAQLLHQIEGFDRGRYGGPVGWVDAHGGGELALALRCGQMEECDSGLRIRLYAGAGIVEGSEPDAEVAETDHKLRPMLTALGVSGPVR